MSLLSPDDRQAIAEAYWADSRPVELAEKYNISEQHVLMISKRLDVDRHKVRARQLGGRQPVLRLVPKPAAAPSQYGKTIGDQWVSLPYVSIQHGGVR